MNELLSGNLSLGMVGIAALGYIASLLHGVPMYILKLMQQKFGYDYTTDGFREPSYNAVEQVLHELRPNLLSKHSSGIELYGTNKIDIFGDLDIKEELGPGTYTILRDWTWVTVIKDVNRLEMDSLKGVVYYTYKLYLLGKNAEKIIDRIKELEKQNFVEHFYGQSKYVTIRTAGDSFVRGDNYSRTTKRDINTVFNKEKDIMLNHVNKWLSNKNIYRDNGLPWKTGILMYGKPGTGKSTMIKALASYLNWNILLISNRNQLSAAWDRINPRTIVVFEEMDKICPKNGGNPASSMTGTIIESTRTIMQWLDGLASRDGVIFVATTNHIEDLDPALIRPGRFDISLKMDYIEKDYAIQMIKHYGLNPDDFDLSAETYNPSELQIEIFSRLGGYSNDVS